MTTLVEWDPEGDGKWRATLGDGSVVRGKDKQELEELLDFLDAMDACREPRHYASQRKVRR